MMKKGLICLLIVLAVSSLTLNFIPQASSATQDIKILDNYTCYTDNLGNLVVVGEVQNVGTNVIQNVGIGASVTESDGTEGISGGYAWADYLLPGQIAPFYIEFAPQGSDPNPWNGVTASSVTLSVTRAPETTKYQYQGVTIQSQKATPTNTGEYWVTAELKNNGDQTASKVVIIGTFYNSQNNTVAVGYSEPIDIPVGGSKTIKVPAFDLNQTSVSADKKIASWRLLLQVASPIQTDGNAPTVSSNPTINDGSNPAIGGESTSDEAKMELPLSYVVAGMVGIVIVLVAVIALKKQKSKTNNTKNIKPKENINGKRLNKSRHKNKRPQARLVLTILSFKYHLSPLRIL
ncbi:MAG: hypothetical protein ACM3UY_00720 [Methanocella sp.]|jgi:hypothetical protein